MANRFSGPCTHCGETVPRNGGNFERRDGRFVLRCRSCINSQRNDYGNFGKAAPTFKDIVP